MCNDSTPLDVPCSPYGEEVIYEILGDISWGPHRQFNFPSRDFGKDTVGCVAALQTIIGQGLRGPQFETCNGCNHTDAAGQAMFNMSLAAFLVGAQPGSYFGAGVHFHADPDWSFKWPALQLPVGLPTGPARQTGVTFTRSFEHVTATVDCSSQKGTLTWISSR